MLLFSVIVPIYNVANHFHKGLRCLTQQTFINFEIILVDDGSTDGCAQLCEEAAVHHTNIKVIHQLNSGAGSARNVGIETSTGEYICFFDIDDSVEPNWLEKIWCHIETTKPQLLISGYREINTRYGYEAICTFEVGEYFTNGEIKASYVDRISSMRFNNGFVWNKVYERDFLIKNNLRFPDLKIQQDEVFNLNVFLRAERVVVTNDVLYNYFVYYSGNTRSYYISNRLDIFCRVKEAFLDFYHGWGLNDIRFLLYIHHRFIKSIIYNTDCELFKKNSAYLYEIFNSESVAESVQFLKTYDTEQHGIFYKYYLKAMDLHSMWRYDVVNIIEASFTIMKYVIKCCMKIANR